MRVAFVGKGGSGKSTLSGTISRALARQGQQVLALDADNVPGLAYSIGVEPSDHWPLSAGAVFVKKKGWETVITPREAVDHFATRGPDGVRFLQFGKMTSRMTREQQASAVVFLNVVKEFDPKGWSVVIDLSAGPRQAYFGWTGGAVTVLVVVEPSMKSFFTARRLARLADKKKGIQLLGVANKVASPRHRKLIAAELERLKIPYWAEVPADAALAEAERHGKPPIEVAPQSKAVRALEDIAKRLLEMPAPRQRKPASAGRNPSSAGAKPVAGPKKRTAMPGANSKQTTPSKTRFKAAGGRPEPRKTVTRSGVRG